MSCSGESSATSKGSDDGGCSVISLLLCFDNLTTLIDDSMIL